MNALFITHHCATVDTFATCDFNFRMRKYAPCVPRLTVIKYNGSNTTEISSVYIGNTSKLIILRPPKNTLVFIRNSYFAPSLYKGV